MFCFVFNVDGIDFVEVMYDLDLVEMLFIVCFKIFIMLEMLVNV